MRDITQLHPKLQKTIPVFLAKCEMAGRKIKIGECARTKQEQDALYAQGRTKPGNIVTNAKGSTYSSHHQFGTAVDIYRADGMGSYYNEDGFFDEVGKIGQSLGLEWGGSWHSIIDKPHFQLPDWGSDTSLLKKKYGTPDKFKKTWYPVKPKLMVTQKSAEQYVLWLQSQLNKAFKSLNMPIVIEVDGIYGKLVKAAVKELYRLLRWDKSGKADGSKVGIKTIKELMKY
jgi:peptidoglycan L-alanyl-D-glutamate endopeptidase CwlK